MELNTASEVIIPSNSPREFHKNSDFQVEKERNYRRFGVNINYKNYLRGIVD